MLSRFYKNHSAAILWLVALSFPLLFVTAASIPSNNDIETWLPKGSLVRATYEKFKKDFGVEEVILIGIDQQSVDDKLIEAVCTRLDRLPGVRKCWSPARLQATMHEMGVSHEESRERLTGLSVSDQGNLVGLIALLSDDGLKDRAGTVTDIERELDYCQLRGKELCLAGSPVVVTELDRLGGQEENQKFFLITLIICLGLLYYWIRDWKLTLSILGLTLWAIQLTVAIFCVAGGEMNFILGALSVMVMVFTLEACIHVLHYHKASQHAEDPLGEALRLSWKPCGMSMLTTAIGLFSVSVSDILPVTQFGYASALGAVVSMMTGLLITPALLMVLPHSEHVAEEEEGNRIITWLSNWLLGHSRKVVVATGVLVAISCVGIIKIESKIDPLDFLPHDGKVRADVRRVEQDLTNLDSIEAVVDFTASELPFVERLREVRELEQEIRKHPSVRHTMSLAGFFPTVLPENPLELMKLLGRAESRKGKNDFLSHGENLWRISARIDTKKGKPCGVVYHELAAMTDGKPIRYTGIAPLLNQAQNEIFNGFWKSFTSAFAVITLVMLLSLRSPVTTVLAMIPNLVPIVIVFGALGWYGFPVDIGMMMTGSIALGITVDGTYHFLMRYQERIASGHDSTRSVREALVTTGGPIFESIIVSSIGMLALALSSFAPTMRFGVLMAVLLLTALFGGLVLLPALLCLKPTGKPKLAVMPPPVSPPLPPSEPEPVLSHTAARRRVIRVPADRVA